MLIYSSYFGVYMNNFEKDLNNLIKITANQDTNCHNITLLDVCPYTKYYYYLKISAIIALNYQEYLRFFYLNKQNYKEYFNIDTFLKIIPVLKIVDYESYLLWNQIITQFHPEEIKENIFSSDYYATSISYAPHPIREANRHLPASPA